MSLIEQPLVDLDQEIRGPIGDIDWTQFANCKGKTKLFFAPKAERPQARERREVRQGGAAVAHVQRVDGDARGFDGGGERTAPGHGPRAFQPEVDIPSGGGFQGPGADAVRRRDPASAAGAGGAGIQRHAHGADMAGEIELAGRIRAGLIEQWARDLLIDTGVGERLKRLARDVQVLVVTHSPQVAAMADRHWLIRKTTTRTTASTDVVPLDSKGRREEIARMLSGAEVTAEARAAADKLLATAG